MIKAPKQNLVTLLRRLRKVMPGKVEKQNETEYLVEGLVTIKLNYFCSWESQKQAAKECHPHAIVVSLTGHIEGVYNYKSIFKTRSFSKNKSGDFNLDAVAVAITQALEAAQNEGEKQKEREQQAKEIELFQKQAEEALLKKLPKDWKLTTYGGLSKIIDKSKLTINIRWNQDGKTIRGYFIEGVITETQTIALAKVFN